MVILRTMRKWLILATMAAIVASLTTPAAAGSTTNLRNKLLGEESPTPIPVKTVTIEKKRIDAVVTNIGDAYAVNKETIIVAPDGKQVSIREMPVPCEAELSWATRKGVHVAQRIQITRVHDDASWKWTSKRPE